MLSSIVKNFFQVGTVVPATVWSPANPKSIVDVDVQVVHPELARLLAARDAAGVAGQGKYTLDAEAISRCGRDCKDCIIKINTSAERKKQAAEATEVDESRRRGLDLEHGADVLVFGFAIDLDNVSSPVREVFAPAGQKFVAGPNSITLVRPAAPVAIKTPAPIAAIKATKATPPPSLSSSVSSVSSFGSGSGPVTPPTAAHHRATRPRPMYLRSASSNTSSSSSSSSNFSLPTSLLASPASAFSLADGERIVVRGQKVGKGWF